jgi:hypothetical protein
MDDKRYKICIAGRQSFKSELGKRNIVVEAISNPGHRYLIGTPTLAQTKMIYWSGPLNIKELVPNLFIDKLYDSELTIYLKNGSIIELFSAEHAQRKEGGFAHGVLLDECADVSDFGGLWMKTVTPMLTQTKGWIHFIGVPRQNVNNEYKNLWRTYSAEEFDNWGCYTWKSADVLDKDEIERIKENIDILTFTQEFEGLFTDAPSELAYFNYMPKFHHKAIELNDGMPLILCADFNYDFMAWVIGQRYSDGMAYAHEEVVTRRKNIYEMTDVVKNKLAELSGSVSAAKSRYTIFYGDHAGNQKSVSSRSSIWEELKSNFAGWNLDIRTKPNSPGSIDSSVASVNARLKTVDNKIHTYINPGCKELAKDFAEVTKTDLKKEKDKVGERTHASDGWRYFINYEFPMRTTVWIQ